MNNKKETVFVAMSGGVDSSVVAGLLLKQGYDVVGITLTFNPIDGEDNLRWSCGGGAAENAGAVCDKLGIKHYVIDCAKEFEEAVLRPAWETYKKGRTPSPCIHCNARIKFRIVLDKAKELGADKMATGHYAIIEHGESPKLRRGTYARKDQTYFLFALTKEQLNFTMFPLGELQKPEVREIARDFGFENAERPESQDACFATEDGNFAEALRIRFNGDKIEGDIVTPSGELLGRHKGIYNYTVGQRKGLGIALGHKAYVSKIDSQKNSVTLTTDINELLSDSLIADNVRFTGDVVPRFPLRCKVQIRYRSRSVDCNVTFNDDKLNIVFDEPQKAVSPGQAAVLYDGDRVLGGGWII
ncbi:MAG: tRNA 2-thiouridine(34) synthase MnmA [Deltaproteobacteria bacterium]|nr:tRNA 2-thiouridine(34) synthase MnmA [Deltaproteobacteria bacterium]